jgi:hypothetical protein
MGDKPLARQQQWFHLLAHRAAARPSWFVGRYPSLGVFLNKTSGNNPSSRRAPQQTESLLDNRVSDLRAACQESQCG